MLLDRQRSYACIHPDTYKYFFSADSVAEVWRHLSERYGKIQQLHGFGTMQIDARVFLFRAVVAGNPITVIRKRRCTQRDVDDLHAFLGCEAVVARIAAAEPDRKVEA